MIVDTEKTKLTGCEILLLAYLKQRSENKYLNSYMDLSELQKTMEGLFGKGYCERIRNSFKLSKAGEEELKQMSINSGYTTEVKPKDVDRYTALADKLKQIYPDGKKLGTTFFWKDSTTVIAERLKKFFLKYGEHTDEEIIDATKRYVKSFNGDYRYMQLLKYFIWKNKTSGGELIEGRLVGEVERQSQLAAYIENKDESSPTFTNDWDITLR